MFETQSRRPATVWRTWPPSDLRCPPVCTAPPVVSPSLRRQCPQTVGSHPSTSRPDISGGGRRGRRTPPARRPDGAQATRRDAAPSPSADAQRPALAPSAPTPEQEGSACRRLQLWSATDLGRWKTKGRRLYGPHCQGDTTTRRAGGA